MILRQFLASTQHAPAGARAEAAAALARSYLYGDLPPEAAWEAKTALLALLDDPAPAVRRALAEACAASARAPRPLIVALACDQTEVACVVLARSPVLTDADLVDAAALGCEAVRATIAARHHLSPAVAGALAEIAGVETLVVLARNPTARITAGRMLRMVERHGDAPDLREALVERADLPLEVRHAVAVRLAGVLEGFVTARGWLGPERGARMTREAGERGVLDLCDGAGPPAVTRVVRHLRAGGQLTAGLILRAILSGRMDFARGALADLSGLDHARVSHLMREPRGIADLHRRAGLPEALLPAVAAALGAWRAGGAAAGGLRGAGLSRRMIEQALAACEAMPFGEMQAVTALLARYEAEAARDEAREVARAVAEEALAREAARRAAAAEAEAWRSAQAAVAEAAVVRTGAADSVETAAPPVTLGVAAVELSAVAADETSLLPAGPEAADAVLDALPGAILASFREEQERLREEAEAASAAETVLDGLQDDFAALFRPDPAQRIAA